MFTFHELEKIMNKIKHMAELNLNVQVEPHLVECKLIVKITKGDDKVSYSAPAHIESLSLDDFNKAIELLQDYKNSLK